MSDDSELLKNSGPAIGIAIAIICVSIGVGLLTDAGYGWLTAGVSMGGWAFLSEKFS